MSRRDKESARAIDKAAETTVSEFKPNEDGQGGYYRDIGPTYVDSEMIDYNKSETGKKPVNIIQEKGLYNQYDLDGKNIAYTQRQFNDSLTNRSIILESLPDGTNLGNFMKGNRSRVLSGDKAENKYNRIVKRSDRKINKKTVV